jgi:hypothetical protein
LAKTSGGADAGQNKRGMSAMASHAPAVGGEAAEEASGRSFVVELLADKVYALQNAFALDGRVSSYPKSARGWSVSNVYLLKEPTGAFVLDTGFAAHREQTLSQIGSLIDRDMPVSLVPLRYNEYMSVGNGMAIAEHFNVTHCYLPQANASLWLDFDLPEARPPGLEMTSTVLRGRLDMEIGTEGSRTVVGFTAPLRLINTVWVYDHDSRTLFTADSFTHVWQRMPIGPWLVENDPEVADAALVRSFLLNTRYWWLEGAATDSLREGLAAVFDEFRIETIAPGYGAILHGRELVERQFEILDTLLRDFDRSRVKPGYVSRALER